MKRCIIVWDENRSDQSDSVVGTARKRLFTLLALILLTMPGLAVSGAGEASMQTPDLNRFYSEMRTLFLRHYPRVKSQLLAGKIHFEQDTRTFMIHEPLKTGEWQDARETRGPNRSGILCDIEWRKGEYLGQAMVPQTFDKHYFKLLVMAPHSVKHDAHLYIHLSFPDNVTGEFIKQFTELANNFEAYVD